MRLLSMDLKNFRVHQDTTIDFLDGLTAIVGQNESGKSSVLEALTWAIYGGQGCRGSVKSLRWRGAPARKIASVEVNLELGATAYIVKRNENNAWVWGRRVGSDNEWAQVADGTKGVTEYMTDRIGMSLAEFSSTYLCSQKDVARLAAMGPADRKAFVRRIMGAERLDAAVKNARKEARDARSKLAGMESLLGDGDALQAAVAAADERVSSAMLLAVECTAEFEAAQEDHQRRDARNEEFGRAHARHSFLSGKLSGVRRRISQAEMWRNSTVTSRDDLKVVVAELATLETELENFADLQTRVRGLDDLATKIRGLEKYRARVKDITDHIAILDEEIATATGRVEAYDEDVRFEVLKRITVLRKRIEAGRANRHSVNQRLRGRINRAEKKKARMEKASGSGVCPTCGQELKTFMELMKTVEDTNAEIDTATAELEQYAEPDEHEMGYVAELAEAEAVLPKHDERRAAATDSEKRLVEHLRPLHAKRTKERDRLQQVIDDASGRWNGEALAAYNADEHRQMAAELRELETKEARRLAIAPARSALKTAKQALANHDESLVLMEKERADAETMLEAVEYDAEEHARARLLKAQAGEQLDGHRRDLANAEQAEAVDRRAAKDARQRLEDHQRREKAVRKGRALVEFQETVRERLEGFRGTVLDTVKPEIAELVSGALGFLTDGRHESVEVDDTFGIVVHEGGMEAPVISGGTEDVAALAMRIALSQLISERSGQPLSLLVLDEPFGSLDAERRANVLLLLDRLRDTFSQVVMISHVEETREAADHTVELVYDPSVEHTRVA